MVELKPNTFVSPSTGKQWSYLTAGPTDGPLLFFLHGWPAVGATWKPQLQAFGGLGFYTVAPDMPGYGGTWTSKDASEFALEKLVPQLLELLRHLGRERAVWVGHDWGCGPLWALASHHPEVCRAIVGISVPYRTIEMGLPTLFEAIDRELYPEAEYPHGQWDYQVFYEQSPTAFDQQMQGDPAKCMKAIYSRGRAERGRGVAATATVTRAGGWFGGPEAALPDVPLAMTVLDQDLLDQLVASVRRNGFHGATAWYLNHAANRKYTLETSVADGVLEMPVLFVHTEYDAVCQTVHNPRLTAEMRRLCRNLNEFVVRAGHWGALECAEEVNAGAVSWIIKEVCDWWPGPTLKSRI